MDNKMYYNYVLLLYLSLNLWTEIVYPLTHHTGQHVSNSVQSAQYNVLVNQSIISSY